MFKNHKLCWLTITGVVVTLLEILSLNGISCPPYAGIPLFTFIILLIGYDVLYQGVIALFHFNFKSINLLMLIAVGGAFYLGKYEEAAVVVVLFSLAEHLEDVGIAQSKSSLQSLIKQMPTTVFLKGGELPIEISQIKLGDLIVIKPFQMVPLDGKVVAGSSFVDEAAITGEPIPKGKRAGDWVFAGTWNKQGILEVEVTKYQNESMFAKIRDLTFFALQNKAPTQKFIESFSKYYTPAIIFLAISWMFISWQIADKPFIEGFAQALILLVIACPCALVISTPISIYSAIGSASRAGAIIKGGRYVEALGKITLIAFDKTRTLTLGEPTVTDVIPIGKKSPAEVLRCAASIELFSEHPLAMSIVQAAKKENIPTHEVKNFTSFVGEGAKAECCFCDDNEHFIGALKYLEGMGPISKEVFTTVERLYSEGKSVIILSTGHVIDGIIAIQDTIRPQAGEVIKALRNLSVESVMMTGDHRLTALSVAGDLTIEKVKFECLPEDKNRYIREFQKSNNVVGMVGDGINDAPALASADVGISISQLGSDTAIETASVVILSDHLQVIPFLIELGRKTLKTIKINTFFAVFIKLIVVMLALMGLTNLALAIFADLGVTIVVILNSLRLVRLKRTGECRAIKGKEAPLPS